MPFGMVACVNESSLKNSCAGGSEKQMNDSNREQLIAAAELLQPLLGDLVFVGGCVTGLLITDEAAAGPRATFDVDAIAAITSYAEYTEFGDRLRALGFEEDARRTILDVMPLDEKILGFSNRWYQAALESSVTQRLSTDFDIRMVTAPFFIATKLEAFRGRGKGDFFGSHDLEDLISVVDGRETVVEEIRAESDEFRAYIRAEVKRLLTAEGFLDALPGYLLPDAVSQSRIGIVIQRMRELASV